MKAALTDRQGRRITYVRLSVTDRCNLQCRYCIPHEGRVWFPHHDILTYEEMIRIVRILASRGVRKVRLTGGEPLVRRDLECLIRGINAIPGIQEVTLTTNGVLLAQQANALKKAGIQRINVSLDSMNPDVFYAITGKRKLHAVLDGIEAARCAGMSPVKINVVPMAGMNDGEIEDLAALSFESGIHVRFIEEMPMGMNGLGHVPSVTMRDVRDRLEERWGPLIPVLSSSLDGPARRFRIPGANGEVGFIHAMTRHFCGNCNRIRLTAVGQIRPCLLDDTAVDIKTSLRNGAGNDVLHRLIETAVMKKRAVHAHSPVIATQMVSIGG